MLPFRGAGPFGSIIGIFLVLSIVSLPSTNSARQFFRGRARNGNLGAPSRHEPCHLPSTAASCSPLPPDEWFEQLLDHFDATNVRTWQQRFYTNTEFYKPGGPVFLMIGGEGEATAKWMVQGAWVQYASEHNALLFQLEHRFYGRSHPTE